MRLYPARLAYLLTLAGPFWWAACSSSADSTQEPHALALSTQSLSVGDPLDISGNGFVSKDQGWVDVTFAGTFTAASDGTTTPVNFTVALAPTPDGKLHWSRFGAYRVPFGPGDQIGQFQGKVFTLNRLYNAPAPASPALGGGLDATLGVKPSIVLAEARAMGAGWVADCSFPVTTVVNRVSYLFRFKAVGFTATEFDYSFGEGLIMDGTPTTTVTRLSKALLDNEHAVALQFADVPDNADGFVTSISVLATADDGAQYQLQLPIMVRKPLQVYFTTPMQLAQTYTPEPVSGCIPGGQAGVEVTYSESHAETRTRSTTVTQAQGWTQNYAQAFAETHGTADTQTTSESQTKATTVTDGRSSSFSDTTAYSSTKTNSQSQTSSIDFQQADSNSYNWSVSAGQDNSTSASNSNTVGGSVTGEVSAGLPDLGLGAKVSGTVSASQESTTGWTQGYSQSQTAGASANSSQSQNVGASTTNGTSVSEGVARSYGAEWGISQTTSEANSYTAQQSSAQTRSYTAAKTTSDSIGQELATTYATTETVSTTDTQLLNTKANIPAGQQGMWYRQTTRLIRQGIVIAYDLCGNAAPVGTVSIDDWTWAPDLAIGGTCPPASNLKGPTCYVEPCGGQ